MRLAVHAVEKRRDCQLLDVDKNESSLSVPSATASAEMPTILV